MLSSHSYSKYNIYYMLVTFCIYLMPFWGVVFVPGTYSSVSPIISGGVGGLVFLTILLGGRLSRSELAISAVFLSAILSVLFSLLVFDVGPDVLVIGFVAWSLAVFSFFFYVYSFKRIGHDAVISILFHVSLLVLAFGAFEIFFKFIARAPVVVDFFTSLFSGKTSSRVMLTTPEPSWAAQLMVYVFPIIYYRSSMVNRKALFWLFALYAVVFLGSFSLTGFFVAGVAFVLYFSFNASAASFLKGVLYLLLLLFMVFVAYEVFSRFASGEGRYYISRFDKLGSAFDDISGQGFRALLVDGSIFVRLGYPIIALYMIFDNPFLGVGFDQFGFLLKDYIHVLVGEGVPMSNEVLNHLENNNADPRNFFLNVYLELGVLGFFSFSVFLIAIFKKAKSIRDREKRKFALMLFSVSISMMLNFSTPYFSLYWIVFSLIVSMKTEENCHIGLEGRGRAR